MHIKHIDLIFFDNFLAIFFVLSGHFLNKHITLPPQKWWR